MFLGISRGDWATLWFGLMVTAIVTGIGVIIAGDGFNFADSGSGDIWIYLGWAGIIGGCVGVAVGLIALYLLRPKQPSERPPWRLVRLWLLMRRARISIGFNPIEGADEDEEHSPPLTKSVPPELSQFLTAWMIPAWDKALDVLSAIRGKVRSDQGERIEALLKLGVIEPAADTNTAVQHRVNSMRTDALDPLIAEMYRKYELIVRWIWEAGDMVKWYGPPHILKEWREADDKFLDQLRALVNLPTLDAPALRGAFKQFDEGGVAKIMRKNLAEQENRLLCEPTIVIDADYGSDRGVAAYVVLKITGKAKNARGRLVSVQPMSNEDAIRKMPSLNWPPGLLQWSAKYGGGETATFATECELDILAFENEDDAASIVYLNDDFRKNKLLLEASEAWLIAVEVFGEGEERGSCWFRIRRGKETVFAQSSRRGTLYEPIIDKVTQNA